MRVDYKKIVRSLSNYVFPIFCVGCNREGIWLCADCLKSIDRRAIYACPVCHFYNKTGECCDACQNKSYLDGHIGIIKYNEDWLIGKIIHKFKYNYIEDFLFVFNDLIKNYIQVNYDKFSDIDLIAPVPLHPRRFAERGFNQAELISKRISPLLNNSILSNLLERGRYTKIQARLSKGERIKNIQGAFTINSGIEIQDKNILLVDDVFTTGSTLQECAKVLKQGGADRVRGITIARG